MSSRGRHLRTGRRTSRRRRPQQPVAVSVDEDGGQQQIVDLTCDDYIYEEQFVDLTNFDSSPAIIPDTPTVRPVTRDSNNLQSPFLISDGSVTDDDLPPVPFKLTSKPRTKQPLSNGQTGESSANTMSTASCPVCLDSFGEVKAAGRQVMATTCGHVFCDECLKAVLDAPAGGRKCPTCRKKLSARTVHPLFL